MSGGDKWGWTQISQKIVISHVDNRILRRIVEIQEKSRATMLAKISGTYEYETDDTQPTLWQRIRNFFRR